MAKRFYKRLTALFTLLFICSGLFAQRGGNMAWQRYRHEVSVGYGINNTFASLGEDDAFDFNYIFQRSTFNASYRFFVFRHFAARASFSHAYARNNDKQREDEVSTNARIDYTATVSEFSLMAEYHIFDESSMGGRRRVRRARGGMSRGLKMGVSLLTGISMNFLRPYGEYFGQEVEFRPITDPLTIPNDEQYRRLNFGIPLGAQARFVLNENWRIGAEFGYRFGLSEYINHVSGVYYRDESVTNPDPDSPDPSLVGYVTFAEDESPISSLNDENGKRSYFFAFLTLAYRIKG